MPITRRHFCAGSLGLAELSAGRAASRPMVRLSDYLRGPGPHTEAFRSAVAAAREQNATLVAGAGTILLDDDIVIDWDGFDFIGTGETTQILQRTPGRGFLQLRGHGNHVAGFHFACEGQRTPPSGGWRGYSGFQRVCAVWLEGGGSRIEAVSAENSYNVVCLRGPVRAAPPRPDGRPAIDFTPRVVGNRVQDIAGRSTDFVLTGNQQEDLAVDGVDAADTTNLSVPPHAIYMQNPGSTTPFCGFSKNVRLSRLSARNNPYGMAFKLSDMRGVTITDAVASGCAGGALVSSSEDATLTGGRFTDLRSAGHSFAAITSSQSSRVTIADCRVESAPGQACVGVLVDHGSQGVDVVRVSVRAAFPDRTSAAPFRVSDTSEGEFRDCSAFVTGAARPMFVVGESGHARVAGASGRSASFAIVAAGATMEWDGDASRLSNSDVRAIGTLKHGLSAERPQPRPLPGAPGDTSCPATG